MIAGTLTAGALGFCVLVGVWFVVTSLYAPVMGVNSHRRFVIELLLWNMLTTFLAALWLLPSMLLGGVLQVLQGVRSNAVPIVLLSGVAVGAMLWLNYHDTLVRGYVVVRQCYTRQVVDFFLLPLLNLIRVIYNALIPFVNFFVNMVAAVEFVPPLTLFKCATQSELLNMMAYFLNIPYAFLLDLAAWLQGDFLVDPFTILGTLDAIGLWVDSMVAPLDCFCASLGWLAEAFATFFRLPSLHSFVNCLFNIFIRIIQIPINTIRLEPHRPQFNETALEACCALAAAGDTAEDTLFLLAQTFWALFTSGSPLPDPLALLLSTQWAQTVTSPLCGVVIFANMTLTAIVHYDALTETDGTGIAYLQFGLVSDAFKAGVEAFGQLFVLFNNDAQAFVTTLGWTIVDFFAFLLEWVPGNVWYFLYGGPLPFYPAAPFESFANFLAYYFTNYWLQPGYTPLGSNYTYSTALDQWFQDATQTTQALGNLIGNLLEMQPLAGLIQHTLNLLIGLIRILMNMISFIWPILTFSSDPLTTSRQIDFTFFFNEFYFLAGSAGDMFRQFQAPDPITNLTCQFSPLEGDKSVLCCAGNLVERLIDLIPVSLQQIINFIVDIIALPTGTVTFCVPFIPGPNYTYANITDPPACVRVPDMSVSIFLIDEALCDLTCAMASIIPVLSEFECIFPLPPPPGPNQVPQQPKDCGHVSTCGGNLLCKILRIFTVPLHIVNTFFTMAINGVGFSSFTTFGGFIVGQFMNALADSLEAFGLLINCTLCAFLQLPNASPNCDDGFYQLFYQLGLLLRQLAKVVTDLSMIVLKLILSLVIGFLTGNPIKAVVDFIVGVLTDVFGGLGKVVVDFLVSLFNSIGLGFVGTFIQILWQGFCPLLQTVLNLVIIALKAVTLGLIPIKFVDFCCNGGRCVPSGAKRVDLDGVEVDAEFGLIDGVLYVNLSNWISHVVPQMNWDASNPCAQSMPQYATRDWTNLTEWEKGEVMYCLMKPTWLLRNDNATQLQNSTCDVQMQEFNQTHWFDLGVSDRRAVMDCMNNRLLMEAFREGTSSPWLPQDLLTNSDRKWIMGKELLVGAAIYWQYFSDRQKSSDVLLSQAYRDQWANLGLNVSCYDGVNTVDDLLVFRDSYKLQDYFAWNQAPQYDAVKAISTGLWSFASMALDSLQQTAQAMTDQTMDPSVYLSYSYTLDSNQASASSALMALIVNALQGAKQIADFWSDPSNVKKRAGAMDMARAGGWALYHASWDQVQMMSVEYFQAKAHESRIWAGECDLNETEHFVREYERAMRSDEHSLVFKLSRWWERASFKTYDISYPRDGQRLTKSPFTYTDARGVQRNETGPQRLTRLWGALTQGTPASRRRWAVLWATLGSAKEQVYEHAIRRNVVGAVDYMRRVYGSQVHEPQAPGPVQPHTVESHTRFSRLQRGQRISLSSAGDQGSNALERQREQEKALRCAEPAMRDDGLCHGYQVPRMPPPVHWAGDGGMPAFPGKLARREHASDTLHHRHSYANKLLDAPLWHTTMVHADSFLNLTCYTNITFEDNETLCSACFVLDQLVGRALAAVNIWETYFLLGQFDQSLNISIDLFDYLFDENARVIIGESPSVPVRWPSRPLGDNNNSIWLPLNLDAYLNDATPNKLRLSDFFNSSDTNVPPNTTIIDIFGPLDPEFINSWVITAIAGVLNYIGGQIYTYIFFGTRSVQDIVLLLLDTCLLCDWLVGDDYTGRNKRFSIGETLFIFTAVYIVGTVLMLATIGVNLFSLAFAIFGFMGLLFVFLTFYANWAWLCWYGLPAILGDDTMYFLVYTLLSKCEWFWSFLITGDSYTNDNCYSCEVASNAGFLNCDHNLGFGDIISNVVFTLQYYWPESLQWIRQSRNPFISMLYRIPWVAARINQFSTVDMSDPVTYSQYQGCNWVVTLLPNAFIGALFFGLLALLWPISAFFFALLSTLATLWGQFLFVLYLMMGDIFAAYTSAPFLMSGLVETQSARPSYGDDDDDDDDDSEDAGDDDDGDDDYNGDKYETEVHGEYERLRPLGATRRRFASTTTTSSKLTLRAESNRLSLRKMGNVLRRVYDNALRTDRKQR